MTERIPQDEICEAAVVGVLTVLNTTLTRSVYTAFLSHVLRLIPHGTVLCSGSTMMMCSLEFERNEDVGSCQVIFEEPLKPRVEESCISYVSIAVIRHHDQRQLKEEFILANGSRALDVQNSRKAWHQKQRDHISYTHGKHREPQLKVAWGCKPR